jgi:hypothetical protein
MPSTASAKMPAQSVWAARTAWSLRMQSAQHRSTQASSKLPFQLRRAAWSTVQRLLVHEAHGGLRHRGLRARQRSVCCRLSGHNQHEHWCCREDWPYQRRWRNGRTPDNVPIPQSDKFDSGPVWTIVVGPGEPVGETQCTRSKTLRKPALTRPPRV